MKILIKNGLVATHTQETRQDVLIEDGIVTRLEQDLTCEADEILNAEGCHVLPGLGDAHCHLRDPGYDIRRTFVYGTRSAAVGGFTSIACMANTNRPADNKAVVRYILDKAQRKALFMSTHRAMTKGYAEKSLPISGRCIRPASSAYPTTDARWKTPR